MFHYDGGLESVSFLEHDIVSLAYHLPGIRKSAVIGVGGGRDILTAHYFNVADITGVELNPIFIELHTKHPVYSEFSNLTAIKNLKLHVDDARTWFASTKEKFDLLQMSMIDTWAATGAGAFSLSENGLYALEGWRAFLSSLNENGLFTVSRWYSPGDVNETGRMIGLATSALMDAGITNPRGHIFVANGDKIATLIISKEAFSNEKLKILEDWIDKEGFSVFIAPNKPPASHLLGEIVESRDQQRLDNILQSTYLDLSVPSDSRPFFFNQLKLFDPANLIKVAVMLSKGQIGRGVVTGNLIATMVLTMILFLSIVAVILTRLRTY